jgi:hypothetical protein
MRTGGPALALAFALLVVPASGCLDGAEQTRVDPGEPGSPCMARLTWTQAGVYEALARQGTVDNLDEGLPLDPASLDLPNGTELRGIAWEPDTDGDLMEATFSLAVWRSERVPGLRLTATLAGEDRPQARALAETFLANVTDLSTNQTEDTASELLADERASYESVDTDGDRTNVTEHRLVYEGPTALENLVDRLPQPEVRVETLDDLTVEAEEWRIWGQLALARAQADTADPYAQVTANPFDEVAVEVPIEDADTRPDSTVVNETFERLELGTPEPGAWVFEDTCGADLDVERPDGGS